jgi:hypothetical protein
MESILGDVSENTVAVSADPRRSAGFNRDLFFIDPSARSARQLSSRPIVRNGSHVPRAAHKDRKFWHLIAPASAAQKDCMPQ